MKFIGIDNQSVELIITNYQFPENEEGDWDGNWLNINLKVSSNVGNWQTLNPSLTTWEVQSLIDWFEKFSNGLGLESRKLVFIEPNLSFEFLNELTNKKILLRINFDLESKPETNENEYFVDIVVDNDEINKIINGLKDELNKFPIRKPPA